MTFMREEEKPWKTNLAQKSAQRREQVLHEVEEVIKKASSFEEALRQAVELLKKRFARYSAVTAYVADGEDLTVHISLERPVGPDRVWTGGGPLAAAAQGVNPTVVSDLTAAPPGRGWACPRAARWSRPCGPRPASGRSSRCGATSGTRSRPWM